MIRLQTEKGEVSISDAALSNITGARHELLGVKGMAVPLDDRRARPPAAPRGDEQGRAHHSPRRRDISIELHTLWSTA